MKPFVGTPADTTLKVVALAAAYSLAAALVRAGAPPHHFPPVWISSAIALCALFIFGTRLWPGVWLGAFSTSVLATSGADGTSLDAAALSSAAGIGAGATVQALAGAWVIRRALDPADPLRKATDVLAFALLAGALCSSVRPTVVS